MESPPRGHFYIITAYEGTHLRRKVPLDTRFSTVRAKTTFYLVDQTCQPTWPMAGNCIVEYERNPRLAAFGKQHMAEWSFLLNEYESSFAQYPLYFFSSRFYEKNTRLAISLDEISDYLFAGLERYGWGYLPSYDRPPGFEDLLGYSQGVHLGITENGLELIRRLFGVDMLKDARWFSDFFCNYIGFRSRAELVRYVDYYRPLLDFFFDSRWNLRTDYLPYVKRIGVYRNEKPLTFLFEMVSHLFFHQTGTPFFACHPEGFFEIQEHIAGIAPLTDLPASLECREAWGRQLLGVSHHDRAIPLLRSVIEDDGTRLGAILPLVDACLRRGDLATARWALVRGRAHHASLEGPLAKVESLLARGAPKTG
ncbi:MAG: hypothetical protein K1X42_03955 [Opitutaceae bacterium]|nr:hypothetical protein [Opitutaceae bacterium]